MKNMPANCKKYIVAREVNGILWYYGSWDDAQKAYSVALEIHGKFIKRDA